MSTFVLVHGMSHGGWAWSPLAARLERHGHRVDARRFFAMRLPCTYIRCLRDQAAPAALAKILEAL